MKLDRVGQLHAADALERVGYDLPFGPELSFVGEMLETTSAAASIVWARRFGACFARLQQLDHPAARRASAKGVHLDFDPIPGRRAFNQNNTVRTARETRAAGDYPLDHQFESIA